MPVDFGKPVAGSKRKPFRPTVAQLPPGHPDRVAAIDELVGRSFTAKPGAATARVAKALLALHPSPAEVDYLRTSSRTRGEQAIRAQGEGVHGLVHHAVPALARGALEIAAAATGVGDVTTQVRGPDGKLHTVHGGMIGLPFGGSRSALGAVERAAAPHVPRTVRLGEVEAQFPLSPSHGTAWVQRHVDRLSEKLVGPATRLSESEHAAARVAAKPLVKASARARVPIQAGKNLRQEARRAQGLRAEEMNTLTPSVLHGDEGSQLAHFWWAQLPKDLRNEHGLRIVRDKLALERAELSDTVAGLSGKTPGVRKTPQLRRALGDLRALDQTLGKLDRVVAKTPKLNEHALDALSTLGRDTRAIYEAAGKLKPDVADERAGLVSRWLGLEPTGEEIYVGHRLGAGRASRGMPTGGGTGATKLPAGVTKQNRLILAKSGRVRQSMQTAVEDFQRAQAYHFTTTAKDELARMGEPIVGAPKPGHIVVNPKGHTLPRTWKLDDEERAIAEGFKHEDVTLQDLEEYARNTLAGGADRTRLIHAAQQAGHAADLRQVPEDVARRYFAQFVPHRVVAGTVPGVVKGASGGRQALDLAHDLVYSSLIYANPGYVPANTVANLVMAGLHQGAFLPVNLIRGGQAFFGSGAKLRALLSTEVGMGATRAASSEGRYPGSKIMDAAIGKVAGIPDNVPRISAFLHEAAREGVISKVSPILRSKDVRALEDLLTNPSKRALLNDIRDRANQAMVDFERLGAHEKAVAKRLFFVWAWTRGATRYPVRFALDHPLRSIALGYAAAGAPGAPEDVQARVRELTPNVEQGLPSWLQGALHVGETTIDGHTFPKILPTGSVSPVGTPFQVGQTVADVVHGHAGARTLGEYLHPAIPAAVRTANKQGTFGEDKGSYGAALEANALRLAPDVNLARDLVHPSSGGMYPEDATRLGRLERALRVFPIAVDPEAAYKSRVREGTVGQDEKDAHTRTADLAELNGQLHDLGARVPAGWQQAARAAQEAKSDRDLAYAAARRDLADGEHLAARAKLEITLDVLRDHEMIDEARYEQGRRFAADARLTDRQLEYARDQAWRHFGFGSAGGPGAVLAAVHHAHNQLPEKGRKP